MVRTELQFRLDLSKEYVNLVWPNDLKECLLKPASAKLAVNPILNPVGISKFRTNGQDAAKTPQRLQLQCSA